MTVHKGMNIVFILLIYMDVKYIFKALIVLVPSARDV